MDALPPQLSWQNIISTLLLITTIFVAGWRLIQDQVGNVNERLTEIANRQQRDIGKLVTQDEYKQFQKRVLERLDAIERRSK